MKIDSKKYRMARAKLAAKIIKSLRVEDADFSYFDFFDLWLKNGFFIIPNHFYQPIPDVRNLKKSVFTKVSNLSGIDMDEKTQLKFLIKFKKFKKEYDLLPHTGEEQDFRFHFNNLAFDGVDALVYYCMIRIFAPKNIIEVGSGWSSKIAAKAALENGNTALTCIEPFPQEFMKNGYPGLTNLIANDVQKLPINYFSKLESGDILFIDSSHTVKTGGDVSYLFLEVLPKLKKGVLVHIHDIFFPFDYPKKWVIKEHRFWTEQYLLQAFLMFNNEFKVIYSNSYMGYKHIKDVKKTFPKSPFHKGGSIWLLS